MCARPWTARGSPVTIRYIKRCPRCRFENDELSEICEECGEFLGMVPAEPASTKPSPPKAEVLLAKHPEAVPASAPTPAAPPALYLEAAEGGRCMDVKDGWILGQQHETSSAEIQLADLDGVNFVHRAHCRFTLRDNAWHVTPIEQSAYTNPTMVNGKRILPGAEARLRNGDRLTLAKLTLHVRVVTP